MSPAQRMKVADLEILLQEGEGTTLEFKESLSASLAREMVAFANTIGGRILLGVRDDGTVAGVKDSNALRARVQDMARNCDPPVKVAVEPNAVMHRDWFVDGANVFVEIYTDRIEVVSPGGLPKGMTLADLGRKSVRRNALIADLLHRIGFIEKAGTGVKRIREEAREGGYPEPVWEANGFTTAVFRPNPDVRAATVGRPGPSRDHVGTKLEPSRDQVRILRKCREEQPLTALMEIAGRSNRTKFRNQVLGPLLAEGLLEPTLPDKPRSSKQRYRLTPLGAAALERIGRKT